MKKSIVVLGPCGVGKSLIASALSEKTKLPMIDTDDLLFFIEAEYRGLISQSPKMQQYFIETQIDELKSIKRDIPLTEDETKKEISLVYEIVDLYRFYNSLLGGLKQFYKDFYDYHNSIDKCKSYYDEVYYLNKIYFNFLNKIFSTSDQQFIISPPASFGWNSINFFHPKIQLLQKQIGNFLNKHNTVFLQLGQDYPIRNPANDISVNNNLFLKRLKNYYKYANLEISTNDLFFQPENEFLKQRTWLNVRETLTKDKLKNRSEISNICEQIIYHYECENENNSI